MVDMVGEKVVGIRVDSWDLVEWMEEEDVEDEGKEGVEDWTKAVEGVEEGRCIEVVEMGVEYVVEGIGMEDDVVEDEEEEGIEGEEGERDVDVNADAGADANVEEAEEGLMEFHLSFLFSILHIVHEHVEEDYLSIFLLFQKTHLKGMTMDQLLECEVVHLRLVH